MGLSPLKKQISIFLSLDDWKMIREEAARKKIPMTELCRRWMRADMESLRLSLKRQRHKIPDDD